MKPEKTQADFPVVCVELESWLYKSVRYII